MTWLKQSTAADVVVGPFVSDSDFKTVQAGLTISQADIRLSKNGGAYAQTNNATGATHLEGGDYKVPLDTTDTNTLGRLRVRVGESGALVVWRDFMVVPANVYDSLVAGSDLIDASVVQWTGTNVASPDTAGYPKVTIKSGTGTGELSLTSGAVMITAAAVQAIWDALTSALTTVGSIGKLLVDNIDAAISSVGGGGGGGATADEIADEVETRQLLNRSNVKKNQALNHYGFKMTSSTTHQGLAGFAGIAVAKIRKDNGSFATCTNPVLELSAGGTAGDASISLTSSEMNADVVWLKVICANFDEVNVVFVTDP